MDEKHGRSATIYSDEVKSVINPRFFNHFSFKNILFFKGWFSLILRLKFPQKLRLNNK